METAMDGSWEYYDLAQDQLKAFTRSAVRTKIMLRLKDGSMTAGDLSAEMKMRTSTILHSIKEMMDDDLVMKKGTSYSLTSIGKIQTILLDDLVAAIVLLDQYKDYWLKHDLSGIPESFLKNMGMITRSKKITSDSKEPLKSLENFVKEISNSNYIRGFSSFIAPGFADLIHDCAKRGAKIELILTDEILALVSKDQSAHLTELQDFENFKLYRFGSDINLSFTVTESLLALGLYRIDGGIDLGSEIICIGDDAINWGEGLFEYYKRHSILV
ncbi:MAG: winged helix-turn-helix domain-containing protein [Methanothrix sp.]|nr:winged helix-turn-helix domain-containing protein [Methanothrix sp.]